MSRQQVRCHGDEGRFETMAAYIYDRFGSSIHYIADVAGGQGLLSRILNKKYNYHAEVIDPRGFALKGVANRECEYRADMAQYYDLIVGLHPDEATRPVVESARHKPVIVVPCCNFWDRTVKLGTHAMIESISAWLAQQRIAYEVTSFDFKGPKNIGIVTGVGSQR